jgi:prepilin-type N-terminal cleavage/methylation domain-containing protein
MRQRNGKSGLTLLEMLIVSAVMAFALLGTIKAVSVTRNLIDRGEVLTRLMLRAHSEIEARKALPFDQLKVGATALAGFDDPRTTGTVTIAPLADGAGLRIAVDLVGRSPRGAETIHLAALRFPEGR